MKAGDVGLDCQARAIQKLGDEGVPFLKCESMPDVVARFQSSIEGSIAEGCDSLWTKERIERKGPIKAGTGDVGVFSSLGHSVLI